MNKKTIGLLAIVTTLCVGGIFTVNAAFDKKEPAKKEVTTYYYGNTGGGNYKLLTNAVNPSLCDGTDSHPCVLASSEQRTSPFYIDDAPDDAVAQGSNTAIYTGN